MFRFVLASLILTLSSLCIGAQELRLSQEQQQKMEQLLPGVDVDQELVRALADIFYSRDMPVRVRLGAIAKLVGIDQMPPGTALNRKICIWDIAGRNGPVFQAAMTKHGCSAMTTVIIMRFRLMASRTWAPRFVTVPGVKRMVSGIS